MIVISDTTPLISLLKIGRLDLLKELFNEIYIPKAVYDELICNELYIDEAKAIKNSSFIIVTEIKDKYSVELISKVEGLDLGESEAIILADTKKADLLIMDEANGRNVAKMLGLNITGTIGLLISAYNHNYLTRKDILDCIDVFRKTNRYIGEKYYRMLINRIT